MSRTARLTCWFTFLAAAAPAAAAGPEDAAVRVFATARYPSQFRPWTNGIPAETAGSGTVIDGKRVLTNAHVVLYATEVHVQGRPGEDKVEAKVEFISPDMDLAVLTVKDETFFRKRPPIPRAKALPKVQDAVTVYGFPIGGNDLAVTKGVVSRIEFGAYYRQAVGMTVQISAAVNPGNSGGPAVVDGRLIGIVFSRLREGENIGYLIPNEEIDAFLDDVKHGRVDGKPKDATGSEYQQITNETLRAYLKLDPKVKGGVLVRPPERPRADYPFKEFDVLTRVGEHELDREGMVTLADGLRVPFYALFPKLARNGTVPVTVVRDGKPVSVAMPVTTKYDWLIREFGGEKLPYFIHGPLVFAPLRSDMISQYARIKPALLYGRNPFVVRCNDRVRFPDEELVIVTSPLFPHKIAKGYADPIGQVVREINKTPVRNLGHLVELLRDAEGEFVTFRFAEEIASELMVFRREELDAATAAVLEDNGIAPSRRGSEDMLAVWKKKPR